MAEKETFQLTLPVSEIDASLLAAKNAVSYEPQTVPPEKQAQARENIGAADAAKLEPLIKTEIKGNLFDKNSAKNRNGYILESDSYKAIEGFTVTHPIAANIGIYTFSTKRIQLGANAELVAKCDVDGNIVAKSVFATDNGNDTATITIDENWGASHFAINVYNKDIDTVMVVPGDTMPNEYVEYGIHKIYKFNTDALLLSDPLFGKKISLNGDSICYGAGSTGGYGKILADKYGMTLQNIGVSGGTITAETYANDGTNARHWICRTIANMDIDADYAIVEGGANDASIKLELGAITSGTDATLDDTTFYGAFESMCKQIITRFAGKKIGYIAVHQVHEDFSVTKADNYYWAAKECCQKWGVPFLDLNVSCPPFGLIFPSNTELYPLREAYTYNADGWHPNEAGYKAYYVPKIEAWLKTL